MSNSTTTGPVYDVGPHFSAGRWAVVIIALPLAVVAIMTWIGAQALVSQERSTLHKEQELRTELLAARVSAEFRRILDTLSAAGQHNWSDPASLPGLSAETRLSHHDISEPPADHLRNKAFRQASGVGTAIVVRKNGPLPVLVFAAADFPGQTRRVTLAELSPNDLAALLARCGFEPGTVLLDRSFSPVSSTAGAITRWSKGGSSTDDDSFQTESPLQDFPFVVGMISQEQSFCMLCFEEGKLILFGGLACALLALILSSLLIKQARSRLVAADKKRQFALQEIEHVQKLSSIGRLAAGVAHEINNPLAIIGEKSGLMKDLVLAMPDMPKAQRFEALCDSILHAVDRCRAVTHRLLGFARRMEVRTMELDINEVLREVLGFLEREALFRNITLVQDLGENLPSIESDRGQLQQVFMNLLNNAMAAVSDNGRIRLATRLNEEMITVEVEDNGTGMSREVLAHIFEPFFSTKGEKGTGLGLSITYGIVNKLGGNIEVASEEGKGTLFSVRLPLHAPVVAQSNAYGAITSQ